MTLIGKCGFCGKEFDYADGEIAEIRYRIEGATTGSCTLCPHCTEVIKAIFDTDIRFEHG